MVNEDADSRPISVSELLARHQGDADTTTPAKDGRNRRRAGRDGAVSLAELTGEVPRVASEPTAEPRHTSFPRADRPADRQPQASGMPAYGSAPEPSAPATPDDADNEATGIIERVRDDAPAGDPEPAAGSPGTTPSAPDDDQDDFDSYRSFADVDTEPEVKSRRGLFGRRRSRDGARQAPVPVPAAEDGPTEAIAKTVDRTPAPDPVGAPERTDVIERTDAAEPPTGAPSADTPSPAEDTDRTEVIERTVAPGPDEDTDRAELTDRTEVIERTVLEESPASGDAHPAGGSSEYLANLYSGSAAPSGASGTGDDLRPGETTEVIDRVRDDGPQADEPQDEAPTAATPKSYRLDPPGHADGDIADGDIADRDIADGDIADGDIADEDQDAGGRPDEAAGPQDPDDSGPDTVAHDFGDMGEEPEAEEHSAGAGSGDSGQAAKKAAGKKTAGKKTAGKKTAGDKSGSKDSGHDDGGHDHGGHERSPAVAWLLLAGESVLGVAIGIGLFWGFKELWEWSVPFALVLAVVVIFSIVTVTHVVRRSRDLATTLLAVGVGLLVTIGPLVLLAT